MSDRYVSFSFFFSSRRRHTRSTRDWSSDVCSSDLACCLTETESVATLATLLSEEAEPRVREVLHEIARDEVVHSRMGWAHLAREAAAHDVSFLSAWIPSMLSGTVDEGLFTCDEPEPDAGALLRHGVLPRSRKREIFVRTLEEVVLPGLERLGVDAGPARAWLAKRSS